MCSLSVTTHSRESTIVEWTPCAEKRGGDNSAGENFTECGDVIGGARGQLAHGGDAAQEFVQRFEVNSQIAMEFREERRTQKFARSVVMPFPQGRGKD